METGESRTHAERDAALNQPADFNRESTALNLFDEGMEMAQDWKSEVNRRLAAHRNRQSGATAGQREETAARPGGNSRAAQAAARVAARYANAPTYQDLFGENAEAVVRAAGAAVEAARGAQAAAEAVLAGLQAHLPLETEAMTQTQVATPTAGQAAAPSRWLDEPVPTVAVSAAHVEPRWHDTIAPMTAQDVWEEMRVAPRPEYDRERGAGAMTDAMTDATVEPVHSAGANLIEFPRELVAARKARPRLAERSFAPESAGPQLSIFEVDPAVAEALAETRSAAQDWAGPEWTQMSGEPAWPAVARQAGDEPMAQPVAAEALVDEGFALRRLPEIEEPILEESVPSEPLFAEPDFAEPVREEPFHAEWMQAEHVVAEPVAPPMPEARQQELPAAQQAVNPDQATELYVAGRSHRLLAGVVDAALVTLAYLGAATVVLAAVDQPPSGKAALAATVAGLTLFAIVYMAIFFAFSDEGTPGMRYARIALCTFDDNNPTVAQSLMRIPATLVAALPLGAGLLWTVIDRDGLGLHDRLSKTYQRKY